MKPFAGFGKRHVLIAAAFCVVVQVTQCVYVLLGEEKFEPAAVAVWSVMYFLLFLAALACAVASENLRGPSARATVGAIVVAAAVMTLAIEALLYALPEPLALVLEGKDRADFLGPLHHLAFRFSATAGWSLLIVVFYAMLQASNRAAEHLHAARVAALAAERRMVEGELRAMQGRVDPQLLFDTLLRVEQAYAHDVDAGQEALDALIRFLRAALPADPAARTTLAGERELTEAYLGLVASRADSRPRVNISVAPEANTLAMPAMLLLPLVRWALDDRSATRLEISARRHADALEVSVRSDSRAGAPVGEAHIAGVRERLARLFAGEATLDVSESPDARFARLLIPT
jgi:hypothetical protein